MAKIAEDKSVHVFGCRNGAHQVLKYLFRDLAIVHFVHLQDFVASLHEHVFLRRRTGGIYYMAATDPLLLQIF